MNFRKTEKQTNNNLNLNLFFFIVFSILLLIIGYFKIKISGNFFLSSVIGNDIWRLILLGIASYIFGIKYIKDLKKRY